MQDHLTTVIDAEANVTSYTYSDRDLMTAETSQTTGLTTYVYNEHGELTERTDARGVTMSRTIDPLDRVTFEDYPDSSLDITYTYDDPLVPFSKGRLTQIARHGEAIDYAYDRFGRTTQDGALVYGYDDNGNRTAITYPGNVIATSTYDYPATKPTYSSEGLLHHLERGSEAPSRYVFYHAGMPVATLELSDTGVKRMLYLTTDHLGTPVLASSDTGQLSWSGGFEPFGGDYAGAEGQGVFLRFPGQWVGSAWDNSGIVSLLASSDHWEAIGTGRFTKPAYAYYYLAWPGVGRARFDPPTAPPTSLSLVAGESLRPQPFVSDTNALTASVLAKTVCDGCGGFKWTWAGDSRPVCGKSCFVEHEEDHIRWLKEFRPDACKNRSDGDNPLLQEGDKAKTECRAFGVSAECLERQRRLAIALRKPRECQSFLNNNSRNHSKNRDLYCNAAAE